MYRNPLFTLILGLMVGLALGYVLAERQPVPPGKALMLGAGGSGDNAGMPEGHPPVPAAGGGNTQAFDRQVAEIQSLLADNPNDPGLMTALGNVYFDAGRWEDARRWYERSLQAAPDDANVLTDLGVVYRNLDQPGKAIETLDRAIGLEQDHWQAWYNKVVVLHFDLHEHAQAQEALRTLQALKADNPSVPDLSGLEKEVLGN